MPFGHFGHAALLFLYQLNVQYPKVPILPMIFKTYSGW